ncbi:GFA family protein [Parasphingopyxis lamellibrachiae]|uniref:GFA family protein n=1 Tax=Parasphingopyxis lamellibrachiae TaxID=680125 RepID=UPI000E220280|nr:GFA family protein [Parasphingopyxis lamellibrachiae]
MTRVRNAECRCGRLSARCEGDPIRISVCHCFACQQRSGSPFGAQARFLADKVKVKGESAVWERTTDAGNTVSYHFCPTCGSTVWYLGGPIPDAIAIPVGLFVESDFPAPRFSVWEARKYPWVEIGGEVEHSD